MSVSAYSYFLNGDGTPMPATNYDAMLGADFYGGRIIEIVDRWHRAGMTSPLRLWWGRYYLAEFRNFCEFHKIDFDDLLMRDAKLAWSCAIIALQPGGEQ